MKNTQNAHIHSAMLVTQRLGLIRRLSHRAGPGLGRLEQFGTGAAGGLWASLTLWSVSAILSSLAASGAEARMCQPGTPRPFLRE